MKNLILAIFCSLIVGAVWIGFNPPGGSNKSAISDRPTYTEWRMFGGGPENIHYTTLDQITPENLDQLEVAWTYESGDAFEGSEIQCNPIIIDGVMYATTPRVRVVALDAATGRELWSFDPSEGAGRLGKMRNRGVTYWQDESEKRIYVAFRQWLYSLDAETGKPVTGFGNGGRIDLREGLDRDPEGLTVTVTTPGVVYKDMLIVGSLVSEALPSAPGFIRAYDLRTGKIRWVFRTIPRPGEFGYETWPKDAWQYTGGANNWSGLVVDQKRGLAFVPTGSAAFDFYGANRHGDNLFANTLLCLDANTGERIWHFQAVRHDVWDRDFPSAPALVTLRRDGKSIDAVAQITKSGHVYIFERETGKPLFPIENIKVPTEGVDGEKLAETQPLPTLPPPFARQKLTEDMLTQRTPEAHQNALEQFRKVRSNGQFEPPGFEGTIVFPGFDGAGEWGGAAFDPETGLLYVNSNEMAWVLRIVERQKRTTGTTITTGGKLYQANCAACHKPDLSGSPPEFPSLKGLAGKRKEADVSAIIKNGQGRMPGYSMIGDESIRALARFILTGADVEITTDPSKNSPTWLKYSTDGYNKFLDQDGYPAIEPPWGTLNAIDLIKGEIAWQIPFGEFPELAAKGQKNTGSENYGGAIVTSNGLLIIGATIHDNKFRIFDKKTGKLLWETMLPAAGNATPSTYQVDGRQYIVIAAGGGKGRGKSGGSYVAFALKENGR